MPDEPTLSMVMEILLDLQQSQRQMRDDLQGQISTLQGDVAGLRDEMRERLQRIEARQDALEALVRQHTRRLDTLTLEVANIRHDLNMLRVAVRDYHGAVIGHGLQLTELDERVRRIEQHLGLSRM